MTYIGVDLHKAQFTVCYRKSEEDQVIREFENSPDGFDAFRKTISCFDDLAVEYFGFTRHFIKEVRDSVRQVVLVDVSKNKMISESIKKTDPNDARMLAYGLEKDILPKARLKSEAAHQLRSLLNVHDLLVFHRVRMMNHMYALLSRNGIHIDKRKMRSKVCYENISGDQFEFGDHYAWEKLCSQMNVARADITDIDKKIESASKQMRGSRVLESIPGFGPITVAYLLSTIDNVHDFTSSKALCAYFGIVPRTRMSAGHPVMSKKLGRFRSGAITRRGDTKTRAALTMAVNRVMVHNQSLRDFYDRVKGRRGYRKARTAVARKLLTFLFFALKNGKPVISFGDVDFSQPHKIKE